MTLKLYQQRVLAALVAYLEAARQNRAEYTELVTAIPAHLRGRVQIDNWVQKTHTDLGLLLPDNAVNGMREPYPRLTVKVPTGGGKTLLAVEAIREYQHRLAERRTGLVVWIIPSETIYAQTIDRLRDRSHHLRQLLDQTSGGRTLILEKGQRLTAQDLQENLVVLFVMVQSVSRKDENQDKLKAFQDSGGYDSLFPADHRADLHTELLSRVPNLDTVADLSRAAQPLVKSSLANAIRLTRPLLIVDEMHKMFTDTARATLSSLNPAMVLGLTATPPATMNILVRVTGLELKQEEMVKLDMHLLAPSSAQENDWQHMVREVRQQREALETEADRLLLERGLYIRPGALIQVESTGPNQRGKGGLVHALDVKEYLISQGVPADHIAIKSATQNDLRGIDLFSRSCPIRYFITKDALREGWDFSFTYILGIIPNVSTTTGLTQLVGRILRQPYAHKLGIPALDESYVYFTKGRTQDLLTKVAVGFRQEGLEDLTTHIRPPGGGGGAATTQTVRVKPEFVGCEPAFYLPIWVICDPKANGQPRRRFSYDLDIRPKLDYLTCSLSADWLIELKASFSRESATRATVSINLDLDSHVHYNQASEAVVEGSDLSLPYLTRRLDEVLGNPFAARYLAQRWLTELTAPGILTVEELTTHFGFVVAQLVRLLHIERARQEEQTFQEYISRDELKLVVSDDEKLGYRIPNEDVITVTGVPHAFRYYLYESVDAESLNSLEREVGAILDRQETILWWFRNKVSREWYAIQGWRKNKIRPDFVAAKKKPDGTLELVYVLESKGEQLLGNADTQYKKQVLETMDAQPKQAHQLSLPLGSLNEQVGYHLIEQGQEDATVRRLMR